MAKNVRLEIIANNSAKDDIMTDIKAAGCTNFTIIPEAFGEGRQEPKYGDDTWPEVNFILIVYCSADLAKRIRRGIDSVKEHYPHEGIKIFEQPAE